MATKKGLPKHITIMGETFPIIRPAITQVDGEDVHGAFDYEKKEITVNLGLEPHKAMSVLVHEMMHCWLETSAINSLLNLSAEQEEGLILAFERQLLPVISSLLGSKLLIDPGTAKQQAAKRVKNPK